MELIVHRTSIVLGRHFITRNEEAMGFPIRGSSYTLSLLQIVLRILLSYERSVYHSFQESADTVADGNSLLSLLRLNLFAAH